MTEQPALDVVMQGKLIDLESQRKIVLALRLRSYLFLSSGALLIIMAVILNSMVLFLGIAGAALFIPAIIFFIKAGQKFKEYRHNFKQQIISLALKSVDQSLEFNYQTGLSENDFISSQLFKQEPDRYASQDQVFGTAGKTRFSFSEVHAEYKTETKTKNGTQEHWHTILKGIVFCADFNKNFNGVTIIRPRDFGSSIGAWISDKIPAFSSSNKDLIKLENPNFEKAFVTYSTNQIEARYILTPGMMERLCELDNKSEHTISVSFIDTQLYIAFPLDKDYFEPSVFKSMLDFKSINEDLNIIRFMYGIIKELDLNTRIWGKE